uniref:Putative synaptobrevin-type vesicle transport protein n=1 Tax=Trypanosoma congolense (strain IL3000) TaxID=1068625 RepID=G0UYP4_TRYCI|nr:putative synaptobrevin-type vesicle transport protein [Trypanosoma congolense IL3000]
MASKGCFIAVLIARTHDHIPLCSFTDENYANWNQIRQQEQQILERMESPASAADRRDAKGSYYQSFDHRDCIYFAFQDAGTDLTIITVLNKLLLRNSSDIASTNRLACSLLDQVFAEFIQAHPVSEISAKAVRPFQFIKFESTLERLVYRAHHGHQGDAGRDANGGRDGVGQRRQVNLHYDAIRQELTDVHFVMRKNLEDLMARGEKLETMNQFSAQLVDESSRFYKKTVRMNRMRTLRMYGPPSVVVCILFVFFYFYLF